ncbi:MAG: CHASE domain-containing protein, partial [Betaproteobacteria bacterium]|nr:CHASE domain-containing protein [Betaproteobacteria bacterium]
MSSRYQGIRSLLRMAWLPAFVFATTVSAGMAFWMKLQSDANAAALAALEHRADAFVLKVSERLRAHEHLLRGGIGLFTVAGRVDRAQWHRYVEKLDLPSQHPGLLALGFALSVPLSELPQHEAQIRREGFPHYHVRSFTRQTAHPEATPVVFVEPYQGLNVRVLGFDMASEAERRDALYRARDTGTTTLTGRVTL